MAQVICSCGAVHELIETEGPPTERDSLKCLVCDKELMTWTGPNVPQLHLVRVPELDRE
jgi:hypothetical protein